MVIAFGGIAVMKRFFVSSLADWDIVTDAVKRRFKKSSAAFQVELSQPKKTNAQLGYLHIEVLPKLAQALDETGELRLSEEAAKAWLKQAACYGEYYKLKSKHAPEGEIVFVGRSFADATKEEMRRFIDIAIEEAALRGVIINEPKEGRP